MTQVERFEPAVRTFDEWVRQVGAEQWQQPTPCSDWDVRALVDHVVNELRWVEPLMAGRTIAEVGDSLSGDQLGEDPVGAWSHAAGTAVAAFAEPDAMSRIVHLSYGDESAAAYRDQLTLDVLIHAWDLAKGTGQDAELPDAAVDWAHDYVTEQLPMFAGSGMFAAALPVAEDAGRQTSLLAMLGRQG